MAVTDDVQALLQDPNVLQRVIAYVAARGGSAPVYFIANRCLKCRTATARAYLREASAGTFLVAKDEVALLHEAAGAVAVVTRGPSRAPRGLEEGSFSCKLCRVTCPTEHVLLQHLSGNKHRIRAAASLLTQSGALGANAGGIVLSHQDMVPTLNPGQASSATLFASNTGNSHARLLRFSLLRRTPGVSVLDDVGFAHDGAFNSDVLPPGAVKTFTVTFAPQVAGIQLDVLVLEFDGFSLMRELTCECEPALGPGADGAPLPDLKPSAPFAPRRRQRFTRPSERYEAGEPPPRSRSVWRNSPGDTRVPAWLEDLALEGRMDELERALDVPSHDVAGFVTKLKNCLFVEELQHEVDVRAYDLSNVELRRRDQRDARFLMLEVPGLAEQRPSVMKGDALYVTRCDGADGGVESQGFVHAVELLDVQLRFSPQFHQRWVQGLRFNVRFSISRSTFVFMQAALTKASLNALHPATLLGAAGLPPGQDPHPGPVPRLPSEPAWSARDPPLNEEQRTAVRAILSKAHAPLPYLIFGPPGTGKTVTLTEAAKQVWATEPATRLLLCAPSNWAADQLALRVMMLGVPPSDVLRVCAYSRAAEDLLAMRGAPDLKPCTNYDEGEGAFLLAPSLLPRVKSKRVVVATCLMAAKLHALGVEAGHFGVVMIDEAGHAEEPLSLAAVAGLLTRDASARLVLAGDPKQLGPVILSPLAQRYGLAVSAMERLIAKPPYARRPPPLTPHNAVYITKLLDNFRSHESILRLPNCLFYDNELRAFAPWEKTTRLLHFPKLPNPSVPIIFHGVVGKDEREGQSPSWFNAMEAKLVVEYVLELRGLRRNPVAAGDIGIISPYRRQVEKIRRLLNAKLGPGHGAKVGSVEEFQGQEREVVIVSTVRSSAEHLEFDAKHRLGFLSNEKRLNVALTRAQALLVVVGNPHVLCKDTNWMHFLAYCQANRACAGCALPPEVLSQAARVPSGGAVAMPPPPGPATMAAAGAAPGAGTGVGDAQQQAEEAALMGLLSRLAVSCAGAGGGDGGVPLGDAGFVVEGLGLQVEGGTMPRWE